MKERVCPLIIHYTFVQLLKLKKLTVHIPLYSSFIENNKQTNKQKQKKLKEAGLKIASLFLAALTFQSEY